MNRYSRLGRCLAHFAVDPFLVYVATQLKGNDTVFLPFNRGDGEGKDRGAGNPPPKLGSGFSTDYLWREVWARDSVLDLVQYFVQDVRDRDDQGKLKRAMIFPRYHQLDSVRRLVNDAREHGPGQNYLIQHSAGSGKSNSIAWLAHRLASLHGKDDKRVFDSVIVVTDRVALDRQLSRTVTSFEQTAGLVEHIDQSGKQLKEALESRQADHHHDAPKVPGRAGTDPQTPRRVGEGTAGRWEEPAEAAKPEFYKLMGYTFALILDEAHSSQGGDAAKEMKATLRVSSDDEEGDSPTDLAAKDQKARGRMKHVSTFAFTATPKEETLDLFGVDTPGGEAAVFSVQLVQHAAGDRRGVHPRRAEELHFVPHVLDAPEEGEGGPEVRPAEGEQAADPVRGREPEDDPREGRGDRRSPRRRRCSTRSATAPGPCW